MRGKNILDKNKSRCIALGGYFLGGGGGGSIEKGFSAIESAFEIAKEGLTLLPISSFDDDDIIITASGVGSPASTEQYVDEEQIRRCFELFQSAYPKEIKGIITNENGGGSSLNGFVISAITGIPLVDAPCNGRAHPTGTMGSMGLSTIKEYKTTQVCVGGNPLSQMNLEVVSNGNLFATSKVVREAAVQAGGLVTVLRNPVEVKYVKENAAVGSLLQAMKIGEIFMKNEGDLDEIINQLKDFIQIEVIESGKVKKADLTITGGFDIGEVVINDLELTFWNEYMTAEINGDRVATFPDLITTIDIDTTSVVNTSHIKEGMNVMVVKVPAKNLILGAGMRDEELFDVVEQILNKEVKKYIFEKENV